MTGRSDRWQALVNAAFLVDALPGGARNEARVAIERLLDVFDASSDPLDDFEGYAVRRFVQAVAKRLEDER